MGNIAVAKDDYIPLIKDGNYEAICFKAEKADYLGSEKRLYLHFRLMNCEFSGAELFCAYNFKYETFSKHTKYYTDWSIANGGVPKRKDRMSSRAFLEKKFLVKVLRVIPCYDNGDLKPKIFHYSKVDRIIQTL